MQPDDKIHLGIGQNKGILKVISLIIEDHNRDEAKEIVCDAIDLIYDGEYDTEE